MQITSERRLIRATPNEVWKTLHSVNGWKDWDPSIETSILLESPKPGAMGSLKFFRRNPVHFTLLEIEAGKVMQWSMRCLWVDVIYSYRIIPNSDGTILVFEADCRGGFLWFARWLLENRIYSRFERAMNRLKMKLDRLLDKTA